MESIARDHGSGEWTLEAIQAAMQKEIQIRELEVQSSQNHPHPTASFLTAAGKTLNKPPRQMEPVKKQQSCVFCKGSHVPNECTVVTTPVVSRDERLSET